VFATGRVRIFLATPRLVHVTAGAFFLLGREFQSIVFVSQRLDFRLP
jgi:hypothetical protein